MKNKKLVIDIEESIETKRSLLLIEDKIHNAIQIIYKKLSQGGKVLLCGNGGSAADAQHMAAELMGGLRSHDRPPIASLALTTDTSFITAWSNDTDFESVFSRQVQGLGQPEDVLVGITTSGNSENVIAAVKQAKYKNMKTVVFTGQSGGMIKDLADITIYIPSNNTQRIQEAHIMTGQIICGLIEENLMS